MTRFWRKKGERRENVGTVSQVKEVYTVFLQKKTAFKSRGFSGGFKATTPTALEGKKFWEERCALMVGNGAETSHSSTQIHQSCYVSIWSGRCTGAVGPPGGRRGARLRPPAWHGRRSTSRRTGAASPGPRSPRRAASRRPRRPVASGALYANGQAVQLGSRRPLCKSQACMKTVPCDNWAADMPLRQAGHDGFARFPACVLPARDRIYLMIMSRWQGVRK